VKTRGLTSGNGATFQVGDARGWMATKSCAIPTGITGTHDWTQVQADYRTLPDTTSMEILCRRLAGAGPIGGKAWYRDVRIQRITPGTFPAVPYLTADASRSADGRTVYLIVINKHQDQAIAASIALKGFIPRGAGMWSTIGPSIDATNEVNPDNVVLHALGLGPVRPGFVVAFPPHSLSAVKLRR
jgi:alpha-N-arabinofuranosidase